MKREITTIKDIAKTLGLSTSTVSRALRDSYEISDETKQKVLEYANKINYKPNPIALSLKERRTYTIGVVLSEIANNFYSQIIDGVDAIAIKKGYQVVISQTHESFELQKMIISNFGSRAIDGLLVALSADTTDINYLKDLQASGLPIVFFDRITNEINTHKVVIDNYQSSFTITENLLKKGKKKIVHITNSAHLPNMMERLAGYKAALEKYGIQFDPNLVRYTRETGNIALDLQHVIQDITKTDCDGLFIANDRQTTGSLLALKRTNPEKLRHLGIVGFTNSNLIELVAAEVDIVYQPAFEMGQIATQLLLELIEAKRPITEFKTIALQSEIIHYSGE
ncbi:LacI family DNA-binding transcriptional regulator [Rhizosphaericola mali]|uniref:LacI family transcriptional regulator n=1 Tax=Rhizosphaericola mali TaxID=2545455 RepID=A0A5P2G6F8_9BACT|nr:LacI family DNA-binding transcriptional regulator [Rhizosphaericola mali]QES88803.1 LacI family transcriptional regulator [Rhizosphaericola mali]